MSVKTHVLNDSGTLSPFEKRLVAKMNKMIEKLCKKHGVNYLFCETMAGKLSHDNGENLNITFVIHTGDWPPYEQESCPTTEPLH